MPGDEQHEEGAGRALAIHAVVFVAVNLLLVAVWVLTGKGSLGDVPGYLTSLSDARDAGYWPIYVLVFWGAGLLIHAGIVAAGAPARWRARRRRRRERRRLHASVVGVVDGTPLEGVALAGVRMVDGDKAAKQAKKDAGKKRKKAKKAKKSSADRATKRAAAEAGTATASRAGRRGGATAASGGTGDGAGRGATTVAPAAPGPDRRDPARDGDGPARFGRRATDRVPTRHWVAVLFTDIVDSTPLNRALGDDAWADLLAAHRALVRTCVAEHGGTEVGTQGDGFLVRFEVPDEAAACAVELQRRLAAERARTPTGVHVRMGIHAGEVVQNDDDLVGSVINLASRVTAVAGADEILVTEPFADHLGGTRLLVDRGLRTLKGFEQPRHLLALVWDEASDTIVLDPASPAADG